MTSVAARQVRSADLAEKITTSLTEWDVCLILFAKSLHQMTADLPSTQWPAVTACPDGLAAPYRLSDGNTPLIHLLISAIYKLFVCVFT